MCSDDRPALLPGYRPQGWEFLDNTPKKLGFSAVGVTAAGPLPPPAVKYYHNWLGNHYNASMLYMAKKTSIRENTADQKLLCHTSAIVVVAMPYGNGRVKDGIWRYVARHARGRDYHKTMKKRLKQLAETILQYYPTATCRIFVDSAPVMERSLALLSGLGNIGKNGALIVRGIGPRVLLGEIFLAGVPSPLEPYVPERPFQICKTCTKCIEACPTGAIVAPGFIDARRCLSFWTVESDASSFPNEISAKTSTIFGCDLCTTVCPMNGPVSTELEAPTSAIPVPLSLEELLTLSNESVKASLQGTALYRTGVHNLKRNAAIVINKFGEKNETP